MGQEVTVIAGNYMSVRVAKVLEQILIHLQDGNTEEEGLLLELVNNCLKRIKMPLLVTREFMNKKDKAFLSNTHLL